MKGCEISILHLASDEKFIDAAIYIFEKAFPGCNSFIIPKSRFNRKLKYITKVDNIKLIPYTNRIITNLSKETRKYDCVFLHGITELNSSVFLQSEEKSKFVGVLWGAELYVQENFPETNLTGDLTSALSLKSQSSFQDKIKDVIRKIIYRRSFAGFDASKLAASGLSYFCVPYEEEFSNFKEHVIIPESCIYIPFTYYPLEFIMNKNNSIAVNGNNIFIGNSALPFSNHLEAFRILKDLDIGSRKVIVPLSYGNSQYADYIEKVGYSIFKDNFQPLRKFLPLHEYLRELQSCGIVILNHNRQQAVGILIAMLYMGSKVYLNESNTLFHYLSRIGIGPHSISKELRPSNPTALENLTHQEIKQNRSILANNMGESLVIGKLREAILNNFC